MTIKLHYLIYQDYSWIVTAIKSKFSHEVIKSNIYEDKDEMIVIENYADLQTARQLNSRIKRYLREKFKDDYIAIKYHFNNNFPPEYFPIRATR